MPSKTKYARVIRTKNAEDPALRAWIVLARTYHTIERAVARDALDHGLTIAQFAVLEALFHKGPLPLGKLSSLLLVTAGNITYVVDQLEKRGYVVRERRRQDRRMVYAALTPVGRALIEEIFPEHASVIAELFDVLTPEEQADMRRILKKLGLTVSGRASADPG